MTPDQATPGATHHVGLDLGGTNLKWTVVEHLGDDWHTVDRGHVPTLAAEGPDAVIGRLADTAAAACARWPGVTTVGIGVPGLYDPARGTTRFLVNVPGAWADRPVADPVSAALGLPVALINDARAFGLAELRLGAGRGASTVVGLVLGTGVGGFVAVAGQVHQGHDGTAGEVGHQTINPDGPWCGCGNRGCLEAYARADQLALACGAVSPEAAVEAARRGEQRALDGLVRVGRYLGIGIANLISILSPDRVVIGGGVAAAGDLLLDPIRAELRGRVHATSLEAVELVTAELGTWAGSIGAAVHGAERAAAVAASAVEAGEPVAAGVGMAPAAAAGER